MSVVKSELKKYIDTISDEDAQRILVLVKRFVYPEGPPLTRDELEAVERAEKELLNGDYLTLEEFEQGKRI